MFAGVAQRDVLGPFLKGVAVNAEAEIARQGDEADPLPVAAGALQGVGDTPDLAVHTLLGELAQHALYPAAVDGGNISVARGKLVLADQFGIVVLHLAGHMEHKLRKLCAVDVLHLHIGLLHHMQHYIAVAGIAVVAVAIPVAAACVQLHIARHLHAVQPHHGAEEIRPRIRVVHAGIDDLYRPAVRRLQLPGRVETLLPCEVEQPFHRL